MPSHDPVPPIGGDGHPAPGARGRPVPLTPTTLASLQQALTRRERRRHAYRTGPLRVSWDGAEPGQMEPTGSVGAPFRVPCTASFLEIVGADAEGALLLAVVPLPDRTRWRTAVRSTWRCPWRGARR
jgi:hypothetical protein